MMRPQGRTSVLKHTHSGASLGWERLDLHKKCRAFLSRVSGNLKLVSPPYWQKILPPALWTRFGDSFGKEYPKKNLKEKSGRSHLPPFAQSRVQAVSLLVSLAGRGFMWWEWEFWYSLQNWDALTWRSFCPYGIQIRLGALCSLPQIITRLQFALIKYGCWHDSAS